MERLAQKSKRMTVGQVFTRYSMVTFFLILLTNVDPTILEWVNEHSLALLLFNITGALLAIMISGGWLLAMFDAT